jgi:hypothetical protein
VISESGVAVDEPAVVDGLAAVGGLGLWCAFSWS